MSDSERFEVRNVFNPQTIYFIATQIHAVYSEFDMANFIRNTLENFHTLTFSQRNLAIYQQLDHYLPDDFPTSISILVQALGEPATKELEGYNGFYVMPFTHYVAQHGVEHFELSMNALLEMTMRFTSEWAIRPFLVHHETKTLAFLHSIASHPNPHARRLASEGSRPRLPWGLRLHQYIQNPTAVFTLLECLKNEPTRLVQRSIANSLNDISKDHPDQVVKFLTRWKDENVRDVAWIISHATRSLVKTGHQGTLTLLGYSTEISLDIEVFLPKKSIILGEILEFTFTIHSHKEQSLIIDYIIGFQKANGTIAPKVFKLTTKKLKIGESITLTKHHPIKHATTRMHYTGQHTLQLQINGIQQEHIYPFWLEIEEQ